MTKKFRLRLQIQAVDDQSKSLEKMDYYSGSFQQASDVEADLIQFLRDRTSTDQDEFTIEEELPDIPDFKLPELDPVLTQTEDSSDPEVVTLIKEEEVVKNDPEIQPVPTQEKVDTNEIADDEMDFSDDEASKFDFE